MLMANTEFMSLRNAEGSENIMYMIWAGFFSGIPFLTHCIIWFNMVSNPFKTNANRLVLKSLES
jgi:hypothetical protein